MKHVARLTGANLRTVQNWMQARNGPSGAGLVVLMRHSDQVTTAVLELADRADLRAAASKAASFVRLRSALLAALEHLPEV